MNLSLGEQVLFWSKKKKKKKKRIKSCKIGHFSQKIYFLIMFINVNEVSIKFCATLGNFFVTIWADFAPVNGENCAEALTL